MIPLSTYEHSAPIDLDADLVFDYLSDVGNLPRYFPQMTKAEQRDGDTVRVAADVDGRIVEADAWLRVERADRSLRWGTEGPHDYHGELRVTERGPGLCDLDITLHTTQTDGPDVQEGLVQTVAGLSQIIARKQDDEDGLHPAGEPAIDPQPHHEPRHDASTRRPE
jgi:Polyketide cyclase / dehydrase and lipid transport